MATRFYLPSTGAAAATPAYDTNWDDTSTASPSKLATSTSKITSSMANKSVSDSSVADLDFVIGMWVSDRLAAQTIQAQTVGISIKCSETNAKNNLSMHLIIRWLDSDGVTYNGDIISFADDANEFNLTTAQSRYYSATSTARTVENGDRLVIELGMGGDPGSGASHGGTMIIGDNAAADLDASDADTGVDNPWVDFGTDTLTFWNGAVTAAAAVQSGTFSIPAYTVTAKQNVSTTANIQFATYSVQSVEVVISSDITADAGVQSGIFTTQAVILNYGCVFISDFEISTLSIPAVSILTDNAFGVSIQTCIFGISSVSILAAQNIIIETTTQAATFSLLGVTASGVTNTITETAIQNLVISLPTLSILSGSILLLSSAQVCTFTIPAAELIGGCKIEFSLESLFFIVQSPIILASGAVSVSASTQELSFAIQNPSILYGFATEASLQDAIFTIQPATISASGAVLISGNVQAVTINLSTPSVLFGNTLEVVVQTVVVSIPAVSVSVDAVSSASTGIGTFLIQTPSIQGAGISSAGILSATFSTIAVTVIVQTQGVTTQIYNSFKSDVMNGGIDLDTDTIKVLLVSSGYAFDQDAHNVLSDISSEISGTGYISGGESLTGNTVYEDTTFDIGRFIANNVQWQDATFTARGAVIYKDSGNPGTSPLCYFVDFGQNISPDNQTFRIRWSTEGLLNVQNLT